jgi:hypothetical protein
MLGCTDGIIENYEVIELSVDKPIYAPNDTVYVTLKNYTYSPIFLDGCNQFWLATKTDTGWAETPIAICKWEGILMKIRSGGKFGQKYPVGYLTARHKFVAQISAGCLKETA